MKYKGYTLVNCEEIIKFNYLCVEQKGKVLKEDCSQGTVWYTHGSWHKPKIFELDFFVNTSHITYVIIENMNYFFVSKLGGTEWTNSECDLKTEKLLEALHTQ